MDSAGEVLVSAERNHALDLLKAVAIVGVVLWHAQPVTIVSSSSGIVATGLKILFYALGYHVALLAVPTFLAVSLYLFADRAALRGPSYLMARLRRLTLVFGFWLAVQWLLHIVTERAVPPLTFTSIAQGGPPFLESGSVLYFLFVLIVLTAASFAFERLPAAAKYVVGGGIVLASFIYFEYMGVTGRTIPLQSLANFVVLIPLIAFVRDRTITPRLVLVILTGGCAIMTLHDLVFRALNLRGLSPYHANNYGRVSVVLGAAALLAWALSARVQSNRIVSVLSKYSLGIFAVHKNVLAALVVILPFTATIGLAGVQLDVFPLVRLPLAVMTTAFVVWAMDRCGLSFAVS